MRKRAGPERRKGAAAVRRMAVLLVAALIMLATSGCDMVRFLLEPLPPPPTLPSIETLTTTTAPPSATTTRTSLTSAATSSPASSATSPAMTTTATLPGDDFASRVTYLIVKGLDAASREIVLDEALAGLRIEEEDVDETIEQVFDLFQEIYYNRPEYYFLSGQANAGYVLLRGTTTTLQSVTLKPGFIDSVQNLDAGLILDRKAKLEKAAGELADRAREAGDSTLSQLQHVHDTLIRMISYDLEAAEVSTMNRERSNAASAVLDRLALCQGYAAAFQLVAQQLGTETLLVTGMAEEVNHAWNLVKLDDSYYHIDLTYDDPTPDGGPDAPVDHVHFLRSDRQMQSTHAWKQTDFPAAPEDGAFYYREGDLVSSTRKELQNRINTFVASLPRTIDKPQQMEVLYTGKDMPTIANLEDMLADALQQAGRTGQILYTRRVDKSIVILEFLPPG